MRSVLLAILFAAFAAVALPALAADPLPQAFYGTFSGTGLSETRPDGKTVKVQPRDFDVTIKPAGDGFAVTWKTVEYTIKPDGSKIDSARETVTFAPAGRPGLFHAESNPDVASGQPLYWAYVSGNTLVVSRMAVNGKGQYEVAVWQRTLTGDRMQLLFRRYGTSSPPRTVKGPLNRVK